MHKRYPASTGRTIFQYPVPIQAHSPYNNKTRYQITKDYLHRNSHLLCQEETPKRRRPHPALLTL